MVYRRNQRKIPEMGDAEASHREFLLAALRAAALRAKAMEADINTIGVALKGNLIDCNTAMDWVKECGLLHMVGELPADHKNLNK